MTNPPKKRKASAAVSTPQPMGSAFSALASIRKQVVPSRPVSAASALRTRRAQSQSGKGSAQISDKDGNSSESERKPKRIVKRGSASGPSEPQLTTIRSPRTSNSSNVRLKVQLSAGVPVVSPGRQPGFNIQMSTYIQSLDDWCDKTGYACINLDTDERFTIIGNFGLRVNNGEVTIAGAVLKPSDIIHWICAPLCHAIPVVRCYRDANIEILPDLGLQHLRGLENLSPLYRDIWPTKTEPTYQILYTPEDVPKRATFQPLVIPPEWNKKLAGIVAGGLLKNPVFFVCGPKGAGKSTFTRILSNKIVSSQFTKFNSSNHQSNIRGVNIVDIDPGQAEYTPPGLLSLVNVKKLNVAPPFEHPWPDAGMFTELVHSHAFGSLTPGSDPDLYLDLAFDLCSRAKGAPTIINTPGWIQGTGLDLLVLLISRIHPTEVIYMSESGPAETVEALRAVSKTFYPLVSQSTDVTVRTAAQLRAMQTMSYFHWNPSGEITKRPSWNSKPLTDRAPLVASYKGQKRGFMGFLSYGVQTPGKLLADSLNGMVVALVRVQDPKAFDAFRKFGAPHSDRDSHMELDYSTFRLNDLGFDSVEITRSSEGLPYIANPDNAALDSQYSCTIGLALIRGINLKSSTIHFLTPVPLEIIHQLHEDGQRLVLLHCQFDSPTWAYTESVYRKSLAFSREASFSDKVENQSTVTIEDVVDDPEEEQSVVNAASDDEADNAVKIPWVDILHGNNRRPKGSQAWRVRRDLGRGAGGE